MKMNERVAHLEATVCQLVDNIHELETRLAAKEAVSRWHPVNCDNPVCWCRGENANSCDAVLFGLPCGLWFNHEGVAHRTVCNDIRITWKVMQS